MRRRLVTLDVSKSIAIIIAVTLHALDRDISAGCGAEDCNWTQPLFFFENMSGLFFLANGIGTAISICRQLTPRTENGGGRRPSAVLWTQITRSAIVMIAGAAHKSIEHFINKTIFEPRNSPWPTTPGWSEMTWYVWHGALEQRALVFHGVCTILSSLLLIACVVGSNDAGLSDGTSCSSPSATPQSRVRNRRHTLTTGALLTTALLVLVATPGLRTLSDLATCCVRAEQGDSEGLCGERTPAASPGHPPPFRVPRRCVVVSSSGLLPPPVGPALYEAPGEFDPCDFSASGGLYLPSCKWAGPEGEASADLLGAERDVPTAGVHCEKKPSHVSNCTNVGGSVCDEMFNRR
jgi:hypothetical protein